VEGEETSVGCVRSVAGLQETIKKGKVCRGGIRETHLQGAAGTENLAGTQEGNEKKEGHVEGGLVHSWLLHELSKKGNGKRGPKEVPARRS